MSLIELIAGVEQHEKTLTVYNAEPDDTEALREQFRDRNLSIGAERTPSGKPAGFVVLADDEEFVTATSLDDIARPADRPGTNLESDAYRPILDHLDETTFTSYAADQMLAVSREIEDRAWRIGSGALHSGFQRLSILERELGTYSGLAEKAGLSVHAYASPDGDVPKHDSGLTIHVERAEEIRRTWFVVYNGAGVDVNKCALLAEEREPNTFYGFWTYDPDTVDWIVEHLESTYGVVETR